MTTKRQRITRADGKAINLVQRRGHLSYCYNACCCGRTDRGYAAIPVELYKSEWLKRKLRNVVHMTKGGCLGPCTLANVVTLLFDGHSVWFHSINSEWQIIAIFDYIESMVKADRYLVPPADLAEYVFQFYTWKGSEAATISGQPALPTEGIVFLTHADTDLLTLNRAMETLPEDFPKTMGISLLAVKSEEQMAQLLGRELAEAQIIVIRIHGRLSSIPGYGELVRLAKERQQHLIIVSGTGELNPDFAAVSTVSPAILQETLHYLQAGGYINFTSLLCYLSDHLLMTGFGAEPALQLPEHGIYHPDLPENADINDWVKYKDPRLPTIALTFYRAHWISGNTHFVDTIIRSLENRNVNVLPVFTSSLKAIDPVSGKPLAFQYFDHKDVKVDVLINTISFAITDIQPAGTISKPVTALANLDVPILQAITSGMSRGPWETSSRGLNPLDTAMNVAIPEFDGRIITVPVSFKEKGKETKGYEPLDNRVEMVTGLALRFARLRHLKNAEKRIAFIFTNSNTKASQIGNAVGLDAPASLMNILRAMQAEDYDIRNLPSTGNELIHTLIDRCSYDQNYLTNEQLGHAAGHVPVHEYQKWFEELPEALKNKITTQWGPAPGETFVHHGQIALAGLDLGNAFVALQPPRGYGMDPDAIYHQPDLPPTHHYYALYRWLRDGWGADAIVHVGKHGTLEWLPGKGIGLSENCFPDALLADMPLFYPFIINDPGEGSQAKRRAHAVIIDHLTPPMTSADSYGELAQLTQLVDEYYQVESLDPSKLPLLQRQIWELIRQTNLDTDLSAMLSRDHGDHKHDWDEEMTPEGVPVSLTEMDGKDIAHLIEDIDGYLCELGAAQIRNGLHTLGEMPAGDALVDMLQALTRLQNGSIPGLQSELATLFGLELNDILTKKGEKLHAVTPHIEQLAGRSVFTGADALEVIDELSNHLFRLLEHHRFAPASIDQVISETLNLTPAHAGFAKIRSILSFVCGELLPNLEQTDEEITNLLHGLSGGYIPAGPSGAPTRGMAHILPTGRNFYAVDPRVLPSKAAWEVGQQLAHEVLDRHFKETGRYPESVGISIWGTSAMRTHGDDVAEVLALLGVRPVWQAESRRITGIEIIELADLGRPRIDVTTRISGFFRDAFPHLIDLLDDAVQMVIARDEPLEKNFVRKHYLKDLSALQKDDNLTIEEAEEKAAYRVFGAAPGTYGAGILPLIDERNWHSDADLAKAYVNWGGYAYSKNAQGVDARSEFRQRLAGVEVALHNQDNREHDIFDSDDYLQFHGGMIATIRNLTGQQPKHYFGDSQNPALPVVRDLKEETLRVFRSRVINPKWIESIKKHGYKGGLELTATVDYIFGYDATAQVAEDWMYEKLAETYALDPQMQQFFEESNPWALNAITERLLEAVQRGMWAAPSQGTLEGLKDLYIKSEALLEVRAE
ncbi:cobaltochelatase subunit CobN [Dyadobacter fanqingshengii]|uniref:Cobaltochelatase subunit CobN n=1 Tax=Dyadobacter fanqingshengii TaxID=2906443 RepID=A0A9X1T9Y9_9BACT|nr:cobaltochelatase subunit CobN [Dyadobacter fanqingshengii]MCF0040489.1 cobaltochelatase subunit CobN [Dyadobacter fanqingshengii]USJ37769.1 cobaltochelatase subunit CobN [Dyadobacter fanqingshengii]